MTAAWVVKLGLDRLDAAGPLRLRGGVRGHLADDGLWVRGDTSDEGLDQALRKLGVDRYAVSSDGTLTRVGQRVPCGKLPPAEWLPLARVLVPAALPAALPAARPAPVPVRLVRGGASVEVNVLLASLVEWAAWTAQASQARLRVLRFAADADGRVLVCGSPLPPVPGERFVAVGGIVVPCGWEWRPRVEAAVLAKGLNLLPEDLALLSEAGDCRIVAGSSFVAASRSAVRQTLLTAAMGGEP